MQPSKIWSVSCLAVATALLVVAGTSPATAQLTAGNRALSGCESAVSRALAGCFGSVSKHERDCYLQTGQACATADAKISSALNGVARRITKSCSTSGTLETLKYGPQLTVAALVTRIQTDCLGEAQSLVARTFGGPQAALLAGPPPADTVACLKMAYTQAAQLIAGSFKLQSKCARRFHQGKTCDLTALAASIAKKDATASTKITRACPSLPSLIGLDLTPFLSRAHEQDRCMVPTALGDVGPLALDCGPRPSVPAPPRGQWTQVVLDNATWGTKCGDGSSYAFWIRLAPSNAAAEQVLIHLEGGGVCVFESDCDGVPPSLFKATDDYLPNGPSGGYLSTNPATNPFSDRTMLALPYCTQDVHFGGGVATVFPSITVQRYGAVNVRAALRYLRDVLWAELGNTTPEGYRPDRLQVLFGGVSAGGYGVTYNYHYVLDDLRWIHTTAVPDSGLALDNGTLFSVATLGTLAQEQWNTLSFQPPYCQASICAVGPHTLAVTSTRLKAVPDQQILTVSNQVDSVQTSTTFFANQTSWTNALRQTYCANQGLNGLRYFLPANPTPIHTMLSTTSLFTGLTSVGVPVNAWLADAIAHPDAVIDRVESGSLAANPFTCPVD
ncbi:MAG: hypothetical protein HY270_02280 [Deltaproteobacteria bacterium]|nr:hypothetical protein [Deltaproteobacteria bacterium]